MILSHLTRYQHTVASGIYSVKLISGTKHSAKLFALVYYITLAELHSLYRAHDEACVALMDQNLLQRITINRIYRS